MSKVNHNKINLGLVFFLVFLLPVVFLQAQTPQNIVNYAVETQISGTSAQISVKPTNQETNYTKKVVETAKTINVQTNTFLYDVFLMIFFSAVFVGLFFLLIKRFL